MTDQQQQPTEEQKQEILNTLKETYDGGVNAPIQRPEAIISGASQTETEQRTIKASRLEDVQCAGRGSSGGRV